MSGCVGENDYPPQNMADEISDSNMAYIFTDSKESGAQAEASASEQIVFPNSSQVVHDHNETTICASKS